MTNSIVRHGHKENAAMMAIHRMRNQLDDNSGILKLRGLGREKAELLIEKFQSRQAKKK